MAAPFPLLEDLRPIPAPTVDAFVIQNPVATFFVRAVGHSMTEFGIRDGDLLVVDRSLEIRPGRVVVAFLDGDTLVKQLLRVGGRVVLQPGHPDFQPIVVSPESDFEVWGVVRAVVRRVRRPTSAPKRRP